MVTAVLAVLVVWVLINVLFVLIMVPPRKPRKQLDLSKAALSPVSIDKGAGPLDHDEPLSLRHIVAAIAMGAFFVLAPPLIAALHAVERLVKRSLGRKDGSRDPN
ncbi:hypothetical protein UP09_07290 [Bradyrhizobium sp. LTSP885]|uniref:hypothetical protein n=1 Tax=Bradyrhizobium sp. LTSP885 TaxID=1619232 RepID=UPI0005CA965B|nr:hypothetical protein [Bradyrhizobium sp. LTSP885]KJC49493.1 hypothetical protein UP09_07290 [Bradyrhizobium sp. LTSP885]